MKQIYLCAISNISSGNCSEDCSFCTQSSHNKTNIQTYKQKPVEEILKEAVFAKKNYAAGFCLVTSGKGLDDRKLEFVCMVAKKIKTKLPSLNLIACNGTATKEQLKELKKSGISSYNHNLETSKEYYPHICTTHTWQERFETCLNIKEIGLNLCSGGIFGLGESDKDRISLINSLKELNPLTIPINFFHPNKALPLKDSIFDFEEGLKWIRYVRESIPQSIIMIAGGREITFKDRWIETIKAGANSIVIGNYLTTKGETPDRDIKIIKNNGYEIASDCQK